MKKHLFRLILAVVLLFSLSGIGLVSPVSAQSITNVGWVSIYSVSWGVLNNIPWDHYTIMVWQNYVIFSPGNPVLQVQEGYPEGQVDTFVQKCHENEVQALACIYGSRDLANSIKNSKSRPKLLENIVEKVKDRNLDGIVIDMEANSLDPDTYANFLSELKDLLPGKIISAIGVWTQVNISSSAQNALDFVSVMTYDYWGEDRLPAYGTIETVNATMNMWINGGFSREKLFVAIPYYARDEEGAWIPDGRGLYSYILNAYNPAPGQNSAYDPVLGEWIYWNGPDTVHEKAAWIISQGFGGVWGYELGFDAIDHEYSLERAIWEEINN